MIYYIVYIIYHMSYIIYYYIIYSIQDHSRTAFTEHEQAFTEQLFTFAQRCSPNIEPRSWSICSGPSVENQWEFPRRHRTIRPEN